MDGYVYVLLVISNNCTNNCGVDEILYCPWNSFEIWKSLVGYHDSSMHVLSCFALFCQVPSRRLDEIGGIYNSAKARIQGQRMT